MRQPHEATQIVPFNLALHEQMLARGAKYERVPAYYEDVGDAENGPCLQGHGDYDMYWDTDYMFAVTEEGEVDCEPRDLELEKHEAEMARAYGYE